MKERDGIVSEEYLYNHRCLLSESRDSSQSQSIILRSMRLAAHLLYARQLEKIAQNGMISIRLLSKKHTDHPYDIRIERRRQSTPSDETQATSAMRP